MKLIFFFGALRFKMFIVELDHSTDLRTLLLIMIALRTSVNHSMLKLWWLITFNFNVNEPGEELKSLRKPKTFQFWMKLNRLSVAQQKIYVHLWREVKEENKNVSRSENVATSRSVLHLYENFFDFLRETMSRDSWNLWMELCRSFPEFYERLLNGGKIEDLDKYLMQIAWENIHESLRSTFVCGKVECMSNLLSINSHFCYLEYLVGSIFVVFWIFWFRVE